MAQFDKNAPDAKLSSATPLTGLSGDAEGLSSAQAPPTNGGSVYAEQGRSSSRKRKENPPDIKDRTVTFRLDPADEERALIFARIDDYRSYANRYIQAKRAQALGWRPPEDSPVLRKEGLKGVMEAHERQRTGMLSSNCYLAAENTVNADWGRKNEHGVKGVARYMAGAPLPQYRADTLGIANITGRPGVKIVEGEEGALIALLHINSEDFEGPGWVSMPLVKGLDKRDEYRWPMAVSFAHGELDVTYAEINVKNGWKPGEKFLLTVAYKKRVPLPANTERAATIGMWDDPATGVTKLSVRNDIAFPMDLTHELHKFAALKDHFDGIRRRKGAEIGRGRGSRRTRRKVFARFNLDAIEKDRFHKLANKVIRYCLGSACGTLRVMDLGGGDWPAHRFKQYLKTCGENLGVHVVEVEETSTLIESDVQIAKRQKKREADQRRQKGDIRRAIKHLSNAGKSGEEK